MTKSNRRASGDSQGVPIAATQVSSLADLRLAIVGAGRVGASYAAWAHGLGAGLAAVSGRSRDRLEQLGAFGCSAPWVELEQLQTHDCDVLLVTVADPALDAVARILAQRAQAPVALHASGHFDAEVLAPLRRAGCAVGSLHPLRAFAAAAPKPPSDHGLLFAIDGDPAARDCASRLAQAFGGQAFEISGERRVLYHLAACLAAGGVATVLASVEQLMREAELPTPLIHAYLDLTRGAVDALSDAHAAGRPLASAVTGPAARGDLATLERQQRAIDRTAPELSSFVDLLQRTTLRICRPPDSDEDRASAVAKKE